MLLFSRRFLIVILMAAAVSWGCVRTEQKYDGPTVDAFTGRLTHNGEPVSFPPEEKVTLQLVFEKASGPSGVPIQSDGTFKIGWMPIGKYSAMLVRRGNGSGGRGGMPSMYRIPDMLTIEEGKTEYTIDLGPSWKP
jgi:hypothetical protein